jgi:acetyltransferase-like isoleucine patch superfamily enzyme
MAKSIAKASLRAVACLVVLPLVMFFHLAAKLVGNDRVFPGCSQSMSLFPGLVGVYLRWAFYRQVLPRCGRDAWIGFGTILASPDVRIGDTVHVGPFCVLGDVTLEDDVLLGSNVSIINGSRQHGIDRLDIPVREQPGQWPHVTIGRDSWVGDRAIVMADVGRHCVVGAGSVVVKPVPDFAIVVGNPARVGRSRGEPSGPMSNEPVESIASNSECVE